MPRTIRCGMAHAVEIFCICGYRAQVTFPEIRHRVEILARARCRHCGRRSQQDLIVVRDERPHWMVEDPKVSSELFSRLIANSLHFALSASAEGGGIFAFTASLPSRGQGGSAHTGDMQSVPLSCIFFSSSSSSSVLYISLKKLINFTMTRSYWVGAP